MNAVLMTQYLEFVADRLLVELGCDRECTIQNPFDFMDMIHCKKNKLLWKKVAEYQNRCNESDVAAQKNFIWSDLNTVFQSDK
jgi:ribonucleoside-diphosphate reductase beta chain